MANVSLLSCDRSQTVLRAGAGARLGYLPFGQRHAHPTALGFNGQLLEQTSSFYLLGNGYRAYCPPLARFGAADKLSPFEKGGLNAYAYVKGDPANRTDPSGKMLKSIFKRVLDLDAGWTKNVRKIAPSISVHDDLYKGKLRLNINAHGRPGVVKLHAEAADGEMLYRTLIDRGVQFHDYSYIRLLSCHSANRQLFSGRPAIPVVLAERTGKPVKAFRGPITVVNDVGDLDDVLNSGRRYIETPAGYQIEGAVRIIKRRPGTEYSPEWFFPTSFYR